MNAEIKPVTGLLPTTPPDLAKSKKVGVPLGSLLASSRRQECLPGRPWGAGPILRNPAACLDPRSALRRATSKLLAGAHTAGGSSRSHGPALSVGHLWPVQPGETLISWASVGILSPALNSFKGGGVY